MREGWRANVISKIEHVGRTVTLRWRVVNSQMEVIQKSAGSRLFHIRHFHNHLTGLAWFPRSRLTTNSFLTISMCSCQRGGWLVCRDLGFPPGSRWPGWEFFPIWTLHPCRCFQLSMPIGKLWRDWHKTDWQIQHVAKTINKHNSLHLTLACGILHKKVLFSTYSWNNCYKRGNLKPNKSHLYSGNLLFFWGTNKGFCFCCCLFVCCFIKKQKT